MRRIAIALTAALLLAGIRLAAQESPGAQPGPEPGQEQEKDKEQRKPEPGRPKPGPVPGKEKPEALPQGEIRIRAEQQGGDPQHSWARGFVDVRVSDMRIQGDTADLYEIAREDGSKGRQAVFVGNVVFMREEERLSGERLTIELGSGKGVFENAQGFVRPGVLVEARRIERLDADTYRIEGGRFSSCTQPNPRWSFTSSSARLDVDDKVVAKNVVFKVKSVPAFYLPWLVYPIQEDQRSTGLLFPSFATSSYRGFGITEGFFWAMGRSADQTFYVDRYAKFGWGAGHELRYALDPPSRGTFRSYIFNPRAGGGHEYDVEWNAQQSLPGKVRANVSVRRYSNTLFQQNFQDNLNRASSRSERSVLSLQRSLGFAQVQAMAEDSRTFFGEQSQIRRRLPSVRVSRPLKKLGRSGLVFGLDARAEGLERGSVRKGVETESAYSRFDVMPEVSLPLVTSFLQVNPRAGVRYTRYGASRADVGDIEGPPIERRYFEGSVEVQGPTFSRVFANPGGFYSDKFKHTIGPEVTFRYRSRIDDFNAIPKFDGVDQQLGTNQVDYALVQRFYAKRPGAGGKLAPYEFLSWRIQQSYYVQIREGQNEFDPNYSSGAFGPGGVPDHNSPILSRVNFRPTPNLGTSFNLEYDVNFKQLRTLGFSGNVRGERGSLQATWSRARRLAEAANERILTRDTVRGSASFELLPRRLTLDGGLDYDVLRRTVISSRGRLRFEVQCCGFSLEAIQYNFNGRQERQFRFSIQLANLGSIGNFLADEPGRGAGLGYGGVR